MTAKKLHLAGAKAGICGLFFCFPVRLTGSKFIMEKPKT